MNSWPWRRMWIVTPAAASTIIPRGKKRKRKAFYGASVYALLKRLHETKSIKNHRDMNQQEATELTR